MKDLTETIAGNEGLVSHKTIAELTTVDPQSTLNLIDKHNAVITQVGGGNFFKKIPSESGRGDMLRFEHVSTGNEVSCHPEAVILAGPTPKTQH